MKATEPDYKDIAEEALLVAANSLLLVDHKTPPGDGYAHYGRLRNEIKILRARSLSLEGCERTGDWKSLPDEQGLWVMRFPRTLGNDPYDEHMVVFDGCNLRYHDTGRIVRETTTESAGVLYQRFERTEQ